ncbi:MAG: HD domain-containing protein [Actinomycetota bacterium]
MAAGPSSFDRFGGIGWLERTQGALTAVEKRSLLRAIARGQGQALTGRLALVLGRRPSSTEVPIPPDSALARAAEDAAADQPPAIIGHSYRTWAFGRALASYDEDDDLDDELFYVAALVHDAGLAGAITGEDFTLRSAAAGARIADGHCSPARIELLRDGIAAHATPGITVDDDGAIPFYVQAGATCDLGGLRLHHLADDFVDDVLAEHSRAGFADDIRARIDAEAAAVPDGRFAVLRRAGFGLAIKLAPLPD